MNTTLDEWEILHAVVQLGGFAPAAEQLNRSQSTISYAIARLQEKLGVKLFEQKGRRAHLTELGRTLLADAEPHLNGFQILEQRARSLASGGKLELRLSVDSIYPNERLFSCLAAFHRRFPHVETSLRQGPLLSADTELSAHKADLCISALMSREYFVQPLLEIRLAAVARYDHPLLALKRDAQRVDLNRYTLAMIEGAPGAGGRRQARLPAQRFLSMGTIEAAIDAVRSGLCFGWLPVYRIQKMLDSGELVLLRMSAGRYRQVRLNLVCRELSPSSPELNAFAELAGVSRDIETI